MGSHCQASTKSYRKAAIGVRGGHVADPVALQVEMQDLVAPMEWQLVPMMTMSNLPMLPGQMALEQRAHRMMVLIVSLPASYS